MLWVLLCVLSSSFSWAQGNYSTQQVDNLGSHSEAIDYLLRNPDKGISLIRTVIKQNPDIADTLLGHQYFKYGLYHELKDDYDSAAHYFSLSVEAYRGHRASLKSNIHLGSALGKTGNYQVALETLFDAKEKSEVYGALVLEARINAEIGCIYSLLGFHHTTLEYIENAKQILRSSKSPINLDVIITKIKIASLHIDLGELSEAISLLEEVSRECREREYWTYYAYSKIRYYQSKYLLGEFTDILAGIESIEKEYDQYASTRSKTRLYRLKGNVLFTTGRKEEALDLLFRAFQNERIYPQRQLIPISIDILIKKMAIGETSSAIKFIEDHIAEIEASLSTYHDKQWFYALASELYAQGGRNKLALMYQRKARSINARSIIYQVEDQDLNEFNPIFLQNRQLTSDLSNVQTEISGYQEKFYIVSIVSAIILILILAVTRVKVLYLRRALKKHDTSEKFNELEVNWQLALQQKGNLEKQVGYLKQVISNLQTKLDVLQQNAGKAVGGDVIPKITANRLLHDYLTEPLTKSERKLCDLIIQGFSNAEIAKVLKINPASVSTKKYRVSKKLKDYQHNSIDEYFSKLINENEQNNN